METILFFLLLAVTAYAWRPRRAQRPAVPSVPRLPGPAPRRRPEPFLASLAAFVVQAGLSVKSTARAVHTAVMLELHPPARRRAEHVIMSRDDDDADDDLSPVPVVAGAVPGSGYRVAGYQASGSAPEQTTESDDEPDYLIKLSRAQALETFYAKGGTALDLVALQDGDRATIRRLLALQIPGRVLAPAAGGKHKRRLEQIKAARDAAALEGAGE